jgi:hypothetical protein
MKRLLVLLGLFWNFFKRQIRKQRIKILKNVYDTLTFSQKNIAIAVL